MSGLLALLDDVAAIAKVAAASVDDIAGQAAKAGAKAAGVVIDDAAVTPKYVHGFEAGRELPIIWRIARGSLFNKLVILLPAALVLSAFLPQAITPLLMLGGAYLCFEGAEKVFHLLFPPCATRDGSGSTTTRDPARLEEDKVTGAIKTDFILSAEIMTIALAAIPDSTLVSRRMTLAARRHRHHGARLWRGGTDREDGRYRPSHGPRRRGRPTRALGRGLVRGHAGLHDACSVGGRHGSDALGRRLHRDPRVGSWVRLAWPSRNRGPGRSCGPWPCPRPQAAVEWAVTAATGRGLRPGARVRADPGRDAGDRAAHRCDHREERRIDATQR